MTPIKEIYPAKPGQEIDWKKKRKNARVTRRPIDPDFIPDDNTARILDLTRYGGTAIVEISRNPRRAGTAFDEAQNVLTEVRRQAAMTGTDINVRVLSGRRNPEYVTYAVRRTRNDTD